MRIKYHLELDYFSKFLFSLYPVSFDYFFIYFLITLSLELMNQLFTWGTDKLLSSASFYFY